MKRTLRWLDVNFEAILMVVFFSLMILLVTLQVVLRFVFKTGFSWGEEVARLLFVWMAFSSFALTSDWVLPRTFLKVETSG